VPKKCDFLITRCYVQPTWKRITPHGDTHYCDSHARAEQDFGDSHWRQLEVPALTPAMMEADRERLLSPYLD
jgi:hypothetical protein